MENCLFSSWLKISGMMINGKNITEFAASELSTYV